MSIPEDLLARVEADEHREAESKAKVKAFNPKELLAKQIYTVNDPELGAVRFGDLTIGDSTEIARGKDDQEKGLKVIFYALVKAYPDLKFEDVKMFPLQKGARLIQIIGEKTGFLPAKT